MDEFSARRNIARTLSWHYLGREITFFLPGMFRLNGHTGRYPAVSITGNACRLQCEHCKGRILAGMLPAETPRQLAALCSKMADQGQVGVLISGGCGRDGAMPWKAFIPAIEKIKTKTGLFVSIHSGLVDRETAGQLKKAGVDQALIDVIGDDRTFESVYHLTRGVQRLAASLEALEKAGIPMVPHIVCGLDHGRIRGEYRAVELVSHFNIAQLVIVGLMRLPGTPMARVDLPEADAVADIIAEARMKIPTVPVSLGCARQRGNTRLEALAIDAGVNRMALPSEEAFQRARDYGLAIRFQPTCCSVSSAHFSEDRLTAQAWLLEEED